MRSSTVFALVALAIASPAFAAPLSSSLRRQASTTVDSGAISFGDVGEAVETVGDILKAFKEGKEAIEGLIGHKEGRELVNLEVRQDAGPASGAVNWAEVIQDGVKLFDGVAGGLTLANAIKQHFTDKQQKREDFMELLARQSTDDAESGAVNWGEVFSTGAKIIEGLGGAASFAASFIHHDDENKQQRRDFTEVFARQTGTTESDALDFESIINKLEGLLGLSNNQRREPIVLLPGMKPTHFFGGAQQLPSGVRPLVLRGINELD